MMTTRERFEDRLLHELRRIVEDRPAPAAAVHERPLRRRVAIGAVGVAAATIAVAVVATSGDVTPSAYAVQSRADGAVTVSIHRLSDATDLQMSLRAAGVPAVVDYTPSVQTACVSVGAAPGGGTLQTGPGAAAATTSNAGPVDAATTTTPPAGAATVVVSSQVTTGPDGVTFTIDPGTIKPGQKVYITASNGAVDTLGMSVGTTAAAVPCAARP
jgi:hypothetical protein